MQEADSAPTSLGPYLRSLREARGSSLEDMARSTRVGVRHLEALEEERLADLPSPVFVRGFIRAYCGFLRESPDIALGHYQALAGERQVAEAASAPPRARTTWALSSVVVGVALLVVLGVSLLVLNLVMKRTGGTSVAATKIESAVEPPAAPIPAPSAQVPAPASPVQPAEKPSSAAVPAPIPDPVRVGSPAPSTSVAAVGAKADPPPSSQRLVIRALEASWIRVQTDDGRVVEEVLPAGASREWATERRFVVSIGNAGGVEVTLNGKVLAPLGAKGAAVLRLELPPPPTNSGS